MARQSQSLREKARLANVGGDIRLGQWYGKKQKEAERELARYADAAKKETSGKWGGEGILDIVRLASGFIPIMTGVGTAVRAGLTAYDMFRDAKQRKDALSALKGMKMDKGNPFYKSYMQPQMDVIMNQARGALKGQAKTDIIGSLLSLGVSGLEAGLGDKLGITKLLQGEEPWKATLKESLPFLDEKGLMRSSARWRPFEKLLKSPGWKETLDPLTGEAYQTAPRWLQQLKAPRGPSARDIYEYAQPRAVRAMRPKGGVTVPGAPGYRRPSIRGRIR